MILRDAGRKVKILKSAGITLSIGGVPGRRFRPGKMPWSGMIPEF
jgi:hypothetical protein